MDFGTACAAYQDKTLRNLPFKQIQCDEIWGFGDAHAIALDFMYYDFGRVHKSLRVTLAMQAGLSEHIWSLEELGSLAA